MKSFGQKTEKGLALLRLQRNILLTESDWTQLPDTVVLNKQAWLDYRQNLRDVDFSTLDFSNPTWPIKPE